MNELALLIIKIRFRYEIMGFKIKRKQKTNDFN